jgi:protein gp37
MAYSNIEWTEKTWNPVRGCTRVSAGCQNCYAERVAMRFSGPGMPYEGLVKIANRHPQWTGKIQLVEEKLSEPLHWRKPCRIFVNSMSDLFHEGVPDSYITDILNIIAICPQHTFQVLTKRPKRMMEFFASRTNTTHMAVNMKNLGLGVSVEDQETANERVPLLLKTPAAVRWVSYEPALASVDFTRIPNPGFAEGQTWYHALEGYAWESNGSDYYDVCNEGIKINWTVVGGESGPGARPFDIQWARDVVAQCKAAGVPCFVKQLGSAPHSEVDRISHRCDPLPKNSDGFWRYLNDKKGGDMAEWPEDLWVRQYPQTT